MNAEEKRQRGNVIEEIELALHNAKVTIQYYEYVYQHAIFCDDDDVSEYKDKIDIVITDLSGTTMKHLQDDLLASFKQLKEVM